MKSGAIVRPATFLCMLVMAAYLFWGDVARGALPHTGRGPALMTYQDTNGYIGPQGRFRRPSIERKRHARFRKAGTRHRARSRRVYARAAFRHQAPQGFTHLRHGRHYARKGPAPRVSPVRSVHARFRKTRTLSAQSLRPSAVRSFASQKPEVVQPLRGEAPAAKVAEEALSPLAGDTRAPLIAVSSDGRISANVKNRSLEEMLRLMSGKNLFEIGGRLPKGALVTLVTMEFSDLTLEQAFNRMMRGYNYALIKEDVSDKRVLIVLGEATRVEYKEPAKPAQTPQQSEQTPARTAGQTTEAGTSQTTGQTTEAGAASPSGPPVLLQQRGRMNAANPALPPRPQPRSREAPSSRDPAGPGRSLIPGLQPFRLRRRGQSRSSKRLPRPLRGLSKGNRSHPRRRWPVKGQGRVHTAHAIREDICGLLQRVQGQRASFRIHVSKATLGSGRGCRSMVRRGS